MSAFNVTLVLANAKLPVLRLVDTVSFDKHRNLHYPIAPRDVLYRMLNKSNN